jgi:hypothetical protein
MVLSVTDSTLTTAAQKITKVRYFPVEIQATSMRPLATYDFFVDGVNMNAFVKPFGGDLGDPITADLNGKILIQYHMAIPYNQQYLTSGVPQDGYIQKSKQLQFVDANGQTAITYLPIRVKAANG